MNRQLDIYKQKIDRQIDRQKEFANDKIKLINILNKTGFKSFRLMLKIQYTEIKKILVDDR